MPATPEEALPARWKIPQESASCSLAPAYSPQSQVLFEVFQQGPFDAVPVFVPFLLMVASIRTGGNLNFAPGLVQFFFENHPNLPGVVGRSQHPGYTKTPLLRVCSSHLAALDHDDLRRHILAVKVMGFQDPVHRTAHQDNQGVS